MKIKVILEDVGANHAKVEFEDDCGIEELMPMMDRINRELTRQTEQPANQWNAHTNGQVAGKNNFTPPSEKLLNALTAAAKANGTGVETACREFNVDPDHISARQCWEMIQELNRRSGYVSKKSADFVGDIWQKRYENRIGRQTEK